MIRAGCSARRVGDGGKNRRIRGSALSTLISMALLPLGWPHHRRHVRR
jgi:hypothetical protein